MEPSGLQKINPWAHKRTPPPEIEKVLDSRHVPELKLPVHLVGLGAITTSAALQEAGELIREHIGAEDAEDAELDPEPFLAPDGDTYELNALLIRDICFLRQMQPAAVRCSFAWWLGLALNMGEDYAAISKLAAQLHKKSNPGNSPKRASSTGASSAPPSKRDNDTPS